MSRSGNWLWPTIFVQKAEALDRQVRRAMIDRNHATLSLGAQRRLLSISRSTFYYESRGETTMNFALMRLTDQQLLETPLCKACADHNEQDSGGMIRNRSTP